jgi:hypothetical protein
LVLYTYAIPVLIAVQSPISGLIFGFALWEAWKINRRAELVFRGPFDLGAALADAPALGGESHGT